MKKIYTILFVLGILFYTVSCEDEKYISSQDAKLSFSADTVKFDTIFTTVGSTTEHVKIYNPYDQSVLVSNIRLAGGDDSYYRLNINGFPYNELYDVEIAPHDSIFIFVEVTIDPSGNNLPIIVQDSIEFYTNTNLQDIDLVAWGQDVELIENDVTTSTTWTNEKPYLIYSNIVVEKNAVLTIEPGANLYFHNNTGLYVRGKLDAQGTLEEPITMQGDRLEEVYQDIPDQWNGVLLFPGSHDNMFDFVKIKNANIGLQVGTIDNEGYASAVIANSKIHTHAYAGIYSVKSKIRAYNCLIANCGYYATAIRIGGEYEFYHTTMANYWDGYSSSIRTTPSLSISDNVIVTEPDGSKTTYKGDLSKAYFANSIITGGENIINNELELSSSGDQVFNYLFSNCLIQLADTFNVSYPAHYANIIKSIDPKFVNSTELNFELDTLSPAQNAGSTEIGELFPYDILGKNRMSDIAPDLGAYERIEPTTED